MRGIVLLCVLPFADGLRPMLASTTVRPALATRPVACMNYAGQPLQNYPRQGGGGSAGLFLSAAGLVTTVAASSFALSASGTIAIVAASAAGLFSFKLSKELNSRGVRSRDVAKRVVGGVVDTTLRIGFGFASLVVYTVAAAVSIIVLALTKLSEAALGVAGVASRLKPRLPPDTPMSRAEADFLEGRALQQGSVAPAATELPYPEYYPEPQYQPSSEPPQQQGGSWYQQRSSAPAAEAPESLNTMGQRLAVEQMLQRSRASAETARKVEAEKAGLLQQRQARATRH